MINLIFSVQTLALTDQRLPSLLHRWLLHELMSSHCLEILVLKFSENDQNKKTKQKTTRASLISAVLKSENLHLIHECLKQQWKTLPSAPPSQSPCFLWNSLHSSSGSYPRAWHHVKLQTFTTWKCPYATARHPYNLWWRELPGCTLQPKKLAQVFQSAAHSHLMSEGPFRNKATDQIRRSGLDLWITHQPPYLEVKLTSVKGVLINLSMT